MVYSVKNLTIPNMLLVGSTARNTGKTTFCTEIIRKWEPQHDIVCIKITTIHGEEPHCHHGDKGCGACTNFKEDYEIIEERNPLGKKDTNALLAAGALRVYWVRSKHEKLPHAIKRAVEKIPKDTVIICESNSLAEMVTPGAIVVTHRKEVKDIKPSAQPMMEKANFIVDISNETSIKTALENITADKTDAILTVKCKPIPTNSTP